MLLNVFSVFVEGGRSDYLNLSPGKGWFQHVRGVHGALCRSCAHQGMQFIDEKDYVRGRFYLFHYGFEPGLELSTILGACDQCSQVEIYHPLPVQNLRYVLVYDALGQPFHNCGLSHTGFADEHGVVLGAARKYLYHSFYLVIAPYYGIEFVLGAE